MKTTLRYFSLALCAALHLGCSDEPVARPGGGTSPAPTTLVPDPRPPKRKLVEVDLLEGYAVEERSQALSFDFQATSSVIAFGLDFTDPTPRATKQFLPRAPLGQAVVKLSPAPDGTALISHAYVDGPAPLTASVWVAPMAGEAAPAPEELQIAVVAFSPDLGPTPVALELEPSGDAQPVDGLVWTEHRALLPPNLIGWAWVMVMHYGAGDVLLNGLSVLNADGQARKAPARWPRDEEHRVLSRARLLAPRG